MSFNKCFSVLFFSLLLVISIFGFFPKEVSAVWLPQYNADIHEWSSITSSSDGTKLVAVVGGKSWENGYIYTSTDSGLTWIERTSAGLHCWTSVASSADGTKLAAVVQGYNIKGYVYTSNDSGETWVERVSSGLNSWTSVASSADGTKLAAVANDVLSDTGSYVYTSNDSGETWVEQSASGLQTWTSITSSSDGIKLAATSGGLSGATRYIYTSADSGYTWTARNTSVSENWTSIASSFDGTKLAAASGGKSGGTRYIYTSADSGYTWTARTSAARRNWSSIASSSDGVSLVASVIDTYIFISTDSGLTWVQQNTAGSHFWSSVVSSSDGTKLAASVNIDATGNDGYIYTSQPSIIPDVSSAPVSNIFQNTATLNGYITNSGFDYNTVRGFEWGATTGYGTTTIENGLFNTGHLYTNISSLSPNTTYHYRSYTTNSAGTSYGQDQSFTTLPLSSPTLLDYGEAPATTTSATLNGNVLYTGGSNITIRGFEYGKDISYGKTTTETGSFDVGYFSSDITSLTPNTTYHYRSYVTNATGTNYGPDRTFVSNLNIWADTNYSLTSVWKFASSADGIKLAATSDKYIYTSIDSGNTWVKREILGSHNWISIASSFDGTKLAAVDNRTNRTNVMHDKGYIYSSIDSGETWTKQTNAGSRNWKFIASSSNGTKLVAVVEPGYIYTSTDSGFTWVERTTPGSFFWSSVASSSDGTKLVALTYEGYIYTSTNSGNNWTQQANSGVDSINWELIASSSDGTKLVATGAGDENYIYTSNDSGATWIMRISSGDYVFTSISSSTDGTKLIAVSDHLYISSDSGLTWIIQNESINLSLISLSMSSFGTKLIAMGYPGKVYVYTHSPISPSLTTSPAVISDSSVTLNASITNTGGDNPTERGFQYGPDVSYGIISKETGNFDTGSFSSEIKSLSCGQTYHYRAYAINTGGTSYGEDLTFATNVCQVRNSSGSTLEFRNKFLAEQKALADAQTNTTITPPTVSGTLLITKTLKLKVTSPEVKELQKYLNTNGYILALSGAGSLGKETNYFGPATKKAVIAFQKANKLVADGIVGKITASIMK
jgi:photosystem II stability/assembly factor-like uncharacterized protein